MRISKFLLTICAATVCASLISARADEDNAAQAAARATLLQKMSELDGQPGQPATQTPPPVAVPTETNSPATTPAPATPPPVIVTTNGATVEQPVAPAPAVTAPADNSNSISPATTSSDTEAQATARQALLQKMSEANQQPAETPIAQPAAPAVAPPAAVESKPAVVTPPGPQGLQPIVAPPLPISMTQEAQLQALLEKYKADQITPVEYQKQRAAILAQPDSVSH